MIPTFYTNKFTTFHASSLKAEANAKIMSDANILRTLHDTDYAFKSLEYQDAYE